MEVMLLIRCAFIVLLLTGCATSRQPSGMGDNKATNSISEWRKLTLGGVEQWVSIRGTDVNNPVLLFLHGGPGTPETPFLVHYIPDLENDFVVVSWEQRGAGKSYSKKIPPESMHVAQFVADAHGLTQYLKKTFQQEKVYLMGHSWGTILGMKAIHQYPDDYHAYLAIAQTADGHREELITYEQVLAAAKAAEHKKAVRQLRRIGAPVEGGYRNGLKGLGTKLKWVRYFGGAAFHDETSIWPLIKCVLKTPVYTFREKLNYTKGESFALQHLYDEMRAINLFDEIREVSVPVYFFHGRHDGQVPQEVAQDFFEHLTAPAKKFYVFNNSAHGVIFEEPEKFMAILRKEIR